jgi:glycosyltransferase involved in cell wall biosynthesis
MPRAPDPGHRDGAVLLFEEGGRGGVTDYLSALARALAALGRPVELVTASDHLYPSIPGVTIRGWLKLFRGTSAWRRAVRRARLGRLINGLRFLALIPRVVRLARRCGVVHIQGGEYLPLTVALVEAIRRAGVPIVYTPHNTFDRGRDHGRSRRRLAKLATRTVVHTRFDLSQLPPEGAARAVVIPHGEYATLASVARPADPGEARAELGIDPSDLVALLYGALRPDKGVRELLTATLEVPSVHALIGGEEGGALAEAADLLESPALAGRATVREGFQDMDETARLFAAADVVVLPYARASQSGVLLLAYGFERPVIVYPVGGLPEAVVEGETGWVCDRADSRALAAALREAEAVGAEERSRRGIAGHRLGMERYGWDEIAQRTDALYREVASRASPIPTPG